MAYDEYLADRIALVLKNKGIESHSKKMMGGLVFMVDEKMCVGIVSDTLMVRINPALYDASLKKTGARPMDFTGRPMKGFIYIEPEAIDMDEDLEYWIQLALDFNPYAKSSKKR